MSPLSAWENFYVIVGSSAGALTGLTFLAITLIGNEQRRGAGSAIRAFTAPTVVHFSVALFLAAILSAPWPFLSQLSLLLAVIGLGMLLYGVVVVRRLRQQEAYMPVLEDWLWYGLGPLIAYGGLVASALLLDGHPVPTLFGIAGILLLLLCIGLHNAWDLVTYLILDRIERQGGDSAPSSDSERKD